jgi:Flp pilus assembly pilin Flp
VVVIIGAITNLGQTVLTGLFDKINVGLGG